MNIKELKKVQSMLNNEYNVDNISYILEPMKDSLMIHPRKYIESVKADVPNFAERPDLIEVFNAVHKLDLEDMVWTVLAKVLIDGDLSLQQIMGMYFTTIGEYVDMPYRRGHVLNHIIEACVASGLCTLERMGKYNHLKAVTVMATDKRKQYGYVLPSVVPHRVMSNFTAGYEGMNAITGGALKSHSDDICLDHLERLSNIAYGVEHRVIKMHQPTFNEEPKYKERDGRYETDEEVEERRKDFITFSNELPKKIAIMTAHGNHFFFAHRYDTRLRTYIKAYHFDFIGNKYCRAFVQPKHGAVIQGANEYI